MQQRRRLAARVDPPTNENRRMTTTLPLARPARSASTPNAWPASTASSPSATSSRGCCRARCCWWRGRASSSTSACSATPRSSEEPAARGRHDLSHLLDDQAGHEHRPHDARRGRHGSRSTTRSRRWIPSWRDLTVYRAGAARRLRHAAGRCADARDRPDAPHLGPDLRLPELRTNVDAAYRSLQPRRLRGGEPRGAGRGAGRRAARVLAGHRVELRRLDRRRRPPRRASSRACRSTSSCARASCAARHARHRLPRPRREGRALRRLLRADRAAGTLAPGAAARLPDAAARAVGRRRPGRTAADYLRFCEMLRRGGELGGVRLRRAEDARPDARQPPARRPRHRRPRRPRCSRRRCTRASASASASR